MAINSVARNTNAAHSDAKTAYMAAVQAAPQAQRADLEIFRNAIHKVAEDHLVPNQAGNSTATAGSSAQTNSQVPKRALRAVKATTDATGPRAKRRRSSTSAGVHHKAEADNPDDSFEAPCLQGLTWLALMEACAQDLAHLESSQAEANLSREAGWQ